MKGGGSYWRRGFKGAALREEGKTRKKDVARPKNKCGVEKAKSEKRSRVM